MPYLISACAKSVVVPAVLSSISLSGAWELLRAHALKLPFIIRRKISDNDVIVHGESARKEYADTAYGGTEHRYYSLGTRVRAIAIIFI